MMSSESVQYKQQVLDSVEIFKCNPIESYDLVRFEVASYKVNEIYKIDSFLIIYFTGGYAEYEVDFKKVFIKRGDILFLSPDQVVRVFAQNDISCIRVSFSDTMFSNYNLTTKSVQDYDLFVDFCQNIKFKVDSDRESYLLRIFDLISKERELNPKTSNSLVFQHLLAVLLHQFRFLDTQNFVGEKSIALVYRRRVLKNISVKNNVEFFCNQLKISKSTLQKATRSTYNKSPKDIIEEALLLEAKRQLLLSDSKIRNIGFTLGFTDPTNFTKFFKRNIGVTPDKFRKPQKPN